MLQHAEEQLPKTSKITMENVVVRMQILVVKVLVYGTEHRHRQACWTLTNQHIYTMHTSSTVSQNVCSKMTAFIKEELCVPCYICDYYKSGTDQVI